MGSSAHRAGITLFIGAVQFVIFLVAAEAYYPGYSVSANYISDLGATCGLGTCSVQPLASAIFGVSVSLLGILTLLTGYFLWKGSFPKLGSLAVVMTGIGALGVGLFPETTGAVHGIFSLIAFLFAGVAAIALSRVQKRPLNYFSAILGAATLVSLALYVGNVYLGLGPGGMERMVVYPVLLWGIGFGGHLIGTEDKKAT